MLNLFKKKQMRKNLIKEIKKEFPDNELLHKGLDEGNNPFVEDSLLSNSRFSLDELAVISEKEEEEIKKIVEAKDRALTFYNRWRELR